MTSIAALVVGGPPEPWEAMGFAKLSSEGSRALFSLVDVELVVDSAIEPGTMDWVLADEPFSGPAGTIGCLGVDQVVAGGAPVEKPALWGFVVNVVDLDAVCNHVGPDVVGQPKNAVQRGRRIATARATAGLGIPFALMDTTNK